ncbi:MAG: hypothetical protein H8E46_02560 [FCB group bacterium]|nr:hypothetical protein [FCB group bacterium]
MLRGGSWNNNANNCRSANRNNNNPSNTNNNNGFRIVFNPCSYPNIRSSRTPDQRHIKDTRLVLLLQGRRKNRIGAAGR